MATKKTNSSTGNKSVPGMNRQPTAKKATNNLQVAAATQQEALSNELIGQTAGEVWRVLSESDGQSLVALKKSIDASDDLVLAALGWLAREDKLEFTASGRTMKVSLRQHADSLAHSGA